MHVCAISYDPSSFNTAQFTTAQIPLILGTAKNLTVLTVEPEYQPLSCVGTGQLDMLYFYNKS